MYRWVEHTGELELEVEADDEKQVFEEALAAFRELVADGEGGSERVSVELSASDRAQLLADWLMELAYLAETRGFVPARAESLSLTADGLTATVSGEMGSPPHLVKAVTYHRLAFDCDASGCRATAVLDV